MLYFLHPLHTNFVPPPTGTGAVAAGTSHCYSKSVQQPAAMLKVDSSCSRHNDSRNSKGDSNTGRKRDRAREKDHGGSTGILCLDSLSKIEEILVKAGEGEKKLSEKRPDTAPAPEQQQPLPPQEPNAKISCNSDGGVRTKFKHDGASQRTGEESHTVPEARAPEADESRAMASFGDRAVPPCFDPLKKSALQLPRRGLFGEEHGEEVPRPRPWAIQKYVRSKGPLAWYGGERRRLCRAVVAEAVIVVATSDRHHGSSDGCPFVPFLAAHR